jgi:hypothetical protein
VNTQLVGSGLVINYGRILTGGTGFVGPVPAELTQERPGRTFALISLVVDEAWLGKGRTDSSLRRHWRAGARSAPRSPCCLPGDVTAG